MGKKKKGMTPLKKAQLINLITIIVLDAIFLTLMIVGFALMSKTPLLVILGLFGLLCLIASPGAYLFARKETNNIHCKKCGEKYDYNSDVEWEETDFGVSTITRHDETTAEAKSKVEFHCVCHNCGAEKTFRKKFTVGTANANGKVSTKSLESQVRNYFK